MLAALLLPACSKEPLTQHEAITGTTAMSLPPNTPDTTWRITACWYSINGVLRPMALYTYDSTSGRLSHLTMNSGYNDNWHFWFFTVKYDGDKRYFIQGAGDTTLQVRVDSLGRATDYACNIFGNGQPVAQQGHITYYEPSRLISHITRTMNGVVDTPVIYWNAPDYEPFLKAWKSPAGSWVTLNYDRSNINDSTHYAIYDELDQPDEFPVRIMRLSGLLLPYRFKTKVGSLRYVSGGSVVDSLILTDHVIDSRKKLLAYKWGAIQYTFNWTPVS